jgi:hypothetical protein
VRHIRDGILDADPSYDKAVVQLLDASNAKLDGITDCAGIQYYLGSATTSKDIEAFDNAIAGELEAVEGPNEVDARHDTNWAADTIKCLPDLRSAEPSLPFIAPSLSNQVKDASKLGNLSSYVDFGNGHRYFLGRNPATSGWGATSSCGVYGALSWSICETRLNSGSKPIIITETGYNSQTEVDETTQAKYLSRLPFVNLRAGISRSYIYDLKDYVGDSFGGDGLIRGDDSEKPAFNAVSNEIRYFSDRGAAPASKSFPIKVSGTSTIDHMLFAKRDGSYILAIWNETPSWNPISNEPIAIALQTVTITLATPPTSLSAVTLNDSGNLVAKQLSASSNAFVCQVDDHMTFISLHF